MDITLLQIQNGTNSDLINFKTEIIIYLQNKKFSTKSITLVKTLKMIDKELSKRHEGKLNLVREISFNISKKCNLVNKNTSINMITMPDWLQERKLQTKFNDNVNEDLIWRLFASEDNSLCSNFLGNKSKLDSHSLENIFNKAVINDFKDDRELIENIDRKESNGSNESIISTTNSSYSDNEHDSIHQEKIRERVYWKQKFSRSTNELDLQEKYC